MAFQYEVNILRALVSAGKKGVIKTEIVKTIYHHFHEDDAMECVNEHIFKHYIREDKQRYYITRIGEAYYKEFYNVDYKHGLLEKLGAYLFLTALLIPLLIFMFRCM